MQVGQSESTRRYSYNCRVQAIPNRKAILAYFSRYKTYVNLWAARCIIGAFFSGASSLDFFTTPLPNEYIGSFVRRNKELQCEYNTSKNDYKIQTSRNSDYNHIPKTLKIKFDKEHILESTTLYPMAKKFGTHIKSHTVITPTENWKICEQCIIDDIKYVGVAYIHTQHVVTGITLCYQHAKPLKTICPTCCTPIKLHHINQFYQCHEKYELNIDVTLRKSDNHEYSIFVSDLLTIQSPNVVYENTKKAFCQKLSRLGYGTPENIDFANVSKDINELLGVWVNKNRKSFSISSLLCPSLPALSKLAFFAYRSASPYLQHIETISQS
jgi:hypothetical protein